MEKKGFLNFFTYLKYTILTLSNKLCAGLGRDYIIFLFPRYLHLITQEHAILKEERKLNADFALMEREERDSFTMLSSCVKESHEKERAQAERTKYWSIIGSIIGTIIGIAGSSINNEFKMKELRKLVRLYYIYVLLLLFHNLLI